MWTPMLIKETVDKQREFFLGGSTLDVEWRITQLKKLRNAIKKNEKQI